MNEFHIPSGFPLSKITLDNGLDVIVRHQHQLPVVAVNLWYHVGSKNEERHQRGFTHLFEHLMFEGSLHYPGDFFKHLQRLGANINGSTSTDRTNYYVDIPVAHVELALAMESDRMANLLGALTETKLGIQKDVVKNEYRQNYANRPYGMVWPLIAEALYPPLHPYSWLTIGVMEDIDSATIGDVSSYFRRFYVPSNASLSIVGDIELVDAFALAERYFASILGGSRAQTPWAPDPLLKSSIDLVLHDRVELDRLYLVWPAVPHFHADDAALLLLADVLARGRSSRLYRKLVIDEAIAQDVTAYHSGRELAGSFGIVVTLRPSRSSAAAQNLVDAELATIAGSGVAPEELARVQRLRVSSFFFALEHMGGFGGVADSLNAFNVLRGDPGLLATDIQRFGDVQPEALQAVAAGYLAGRTRVCLSVVGRPKRATSPLDRSQPPASASPVPYRPPLPRQLTLRCGIPLWVFPRSELPTVAGAIVIGGGAGLEESRQPGLTHLMLEMLEEGTTTRTAARIAEEAESSGATIGASCGWDAAYVSFRCLKSALLLTLDLAVDILRSPTFPETEWQRVQALTLAALQAERDNAESRAYRALLAALYGQDHPYRHPLAGTIESVSRIARADLAALHARYLVPGRAAVVVAGDVDPDVLADELDRRLASWSGPGVSLPAIADAERSGSPRLLLLDRPGSAQAVVRVGHAGLTRTDPAFEQALLLNQILGGQFTSRLNAKLREERGLTYGVRSQFDCRRGAGPFTIGAGLQANRIAQALDELYHEVSALLTSRPPTQGELDDARRAIVEGHARHFETPSALVNRFANLIVFDFPADYESGLAERLARIDLDALLAASHRLIHPHSLVVVVVADAAQVTEDLKRIDWAAVERIAE
ncbi:MAG: M16 family metallopeptidase [Isosphaeraceae bacterium]